MVCTTKCIAYILHYFYSACSREYLTDGLSRTNLDLLVDALESIAFKNTA